MSHRTERRHRKKLRDRIEIPPAPCVPLDVSGGHWGEITIFAIPRDILNDLKLVRRAIRNGWEVLPSKRDWLVKSVYQIVLAEHGESEEYTVDKRAISAMMTIIEMASADIRSNSTPPKGSFSSDESASNVG